MKPHLLNSAKTENPRRFFIAWLVLLMLAKLILCANEEIQITDSPHDAFWHIRSASQWYWGGEYGNGTLFHLPLYSLMIRVISSTGVPLRIAMDVIFSASIGYFAFALKRIGFSYWVAGLAAFVGIFNPISFQIFNECGAEKMLAVAIPSALAASFYWWHGRKERERWFLAFIAAVFWAIAWNLRKESIVIAGILGIFALCICWRERPWRTAILLRQIFAGCLLPILLSVSLELVLKTANYLRWGLFASSIITAPGYVAAFRALQSIPPEKHIDYMPITYDVRLKAYRASPTFALIQKIAEDRIFPNWAIISSQFTDSKGIKKLHRNEVSAGWVYWALHDSVFFSHYGKTAAEENQFFYKVAAEIKAAQKEGRLASRKVPVTFIDAAWSIWVKRVPESIKTIYETTLSPSIFKPIPEDEAAVFQNGPTFNEMINARSHLKTKPATFIEGILLSPGDILESITLTSPNAIIASEALFNPLLSQNGSYVFKLKSFKLSPKDLNNGLLTTHFRRAGDLSFELKKLVMLKGVKDSAGSPYVLKFRSINQGGQLPNWRFTFQQKWEKIFLRFMKLSLWSGLPLILLTIFGLIKKNLSDPLLLTLFLMFVFWERILFFAVLDASSWPGNQPRYLFAAMPLQGILIILVLAQTIKAIISFFPPKPQPIS